MIAAPASRLTGRDLGLALFVVAIWGSNFTVAHWGLRVMGPFTLACWRFVFAALPAIIFLRRPAASWARLASFGGTLGLGQFGLLYLAMRHDITPALASIVIQMQAFFTAAMASLLAREPLPRRTIVALAVAALGLALIAGEAGTAATPVGLGLVLVAALSWASCNMIARAAGTSDMLAFMAWSSLFAVPPLATLAWLVEGGAALAMPLRHPTWLIVFVIFWQSAANTLVGYGIWNALLQRYPAALVAPMSLLVPVVATALAWALLGEALPPWKLAACALVLAGLAINQWVRGPARVPRDHQETPA